jgi:hypothetical protein
VEVSQVSTRREKNERLSQIMVFLATHDYFCGMTTIGGGVGLVYSTHLRGLLSDAVLRGWLIEHNFGSGNRPRRKWCIAWLAIRISNKAMYGELKRVKRMWLGGVAR